MSQVPNDRLYSETHQWLLKLDEVNYAVGITDYAQDLLGDLVFIEMPEVGRQVEAQEQCAVVESVKTASDVFAPAAGEIVSVNDELDDEPETVNDEPYDTALFTMSVSQVPDSLMDADAYSALLDDL